VLMICLCGHQHEHPVLEPWPRQCARCGRCWRCHYAWPALCRCPALLLHFTIYEALREWERQGGK
jgi:hypothetical protein